jgi:parvulin-like peptidyl-prolyl isomerase
VQRGKELDVAETDPDVRTAMVNAVEQMAAADVMTALPDQYRLLAYYNAHADRYAEEGIMTVRDLVFAKAQDAGQAVAAIRAGSPMDATLARFHGHDSGKENGEDFYFAAKIHLGDKLFQLARSLSTGGVGGPMNLADGFHILVMTRNTPPKPRDSRTAQPQVLDDYRNEEIKRVMAQYNAFLRKRANVLIAGDMQ